MLQKDKNLYEMVQKNLKKGQTIPTYREMCKLLGEKEKTRNPKEKQLEHWKNFFEYEKINNKFVIYKIYSYEEAENNIFKSILEDNIAYSICVLLQFYKLASQSNKMIISTSKLAESVGLINKNFIKYRIYSSDSNGTIKGKLKTFEKELENNDFSLINKMPYRSKNKYIKEITEKDKEQLIKAIENIANSKKEKNKNRKNKDKNIEEENLEDSCIKENLQLITNYVNDNIENFPPSKYTKQVFSDFYFHAGGNLKYKIDSALNKLQSNGILLDNQWFVGKILKDEDELAIEYTDKGLEIPERFIRSKVNNYKMISLTEDQGLDLIAYFDKEFEKEKLSIFNILYSDDIFVKTKANKILKEVFNLEFIYLSHALYFSKNGLERFQENFKNQINEYVKSVKKINKLLIANSTEFQQQVLENYQKRTHDFKTKIDKGISDSLYTILSEEFLKVLDEISIQWEDSNLFIPNVWNESFQISDIINDNKDIFSLFENQDYKTFNHKKQYDT